MSCPPPAMAATQGCALRGGVRKHFAIALCVEWAPAGACWDLLGPAGACWGPAAGAFGPAPHVVRPPFCVCRLSLTPLAPALLYKGHDPTECGYLRAVGLLHAGSFREARETLSHMLLSDPSNARVAALLDLVQARVVSGACLRVRAPPPRRFGVGAWARCFVRGHRRGRVVGCGVDGCVVPVPARALAVSSRAHSCFGGCACLCGCVWVVRAESARFAVTGSVVFGVLLLAVLAWRKWTGGSGGGGGVHYTPSAPVRRFPPKRS